MMKNWIFNFRAFILSVLFISSLFCINNIAIAHCDTMQGPVVKAAEKSLQTGNINYVLIWVKNEDEAEVKNAFQQTLLVRKLNKQAAMLADNYFFETVVRLHRAGEGAPYTGLKAGEPNIGIVIPAADEAIKTGKIDPVIKLENDFIEKGIHEHFQQVKNKENFDTSNIQAGREYVEAYVSYIHYIEGIYIAATSSAKGHYPEQKG